MNGKVLKIKISNLEFGTQDRYVNILGCFKYLPNGNIYIVYSDVDTKYNIIYFGNGHVRGTQALCMEIRDKQEEEIIKEYIFKVTNKESLDNFSFISLDNVEELEIISSSKIEIKSEIFINLIDIVIPKVEVKEESEEIKKKPKKKVNIKLIIILLLIMIIGGVLFFFLTTPRDNIEKSITCIKEYEDNTINSNVKETSIYNFDIHDKLLNIDITNNYQFTKNNYQNFIHRGTIYKYTPSNNEGTWSKDDTNYTFTTSIRKLIDTSYNLPTNYEEVLSDNKNNGYVCTEEIRE